MKKESDYKFLENKGPKEVFDTPLKILVINFLSTNNKHQYKIHRNYK